MGLFSKKKEETKSCCCGGNCTPKTMAQAEAAKAAAGVKVLGPDAPNATPWKMLFVPPSRSWGWIRPLTM